MSNYKIKDKKAIRGIIRELIGILKKNKKDLFALNKICTQDALCWIKEDWENVIDYLKNYERNNEKNFSKKIKPKGSVLIILSYNEPLLLSIIPILNALIGGNSVKLKPSRKAREIIKKIWLDSGIILKYNLDLVILFDVAPQLVGQQIKLVNAVYFFGGHDVAREISKLCADNFVEFFPEIETADCKVLNMKSRKDFNLERDISLTLRESFSHAGQICHRIQGVVIVGSLYHQYVDSLKKQFLVLGGSNSQCFTEDYKIDRDYLKKAICDIEDAHPEELICSNEEIGIPLLVVSPEKDCEFVKKAYFLPILWVIGFNSEKELLTFLNSRKYYLGLNIFSDDNAFVEFIIGSTKFSRYTINTAHTKIRSYEGWGGVWPSGYGGYKSWLEHFTNPYTIVRK
ncbi:MAG: aldehyde dehydrogenase family protein [Parcubacteria group bacterium]|jgi:aldehyde dehydrogenase (NAD+)